MIRLLSAIATLIVILNKVIKPVNVESKSDDSAKHPAPSPIDIRLPIAVTEYYEAEQRNRKESDCRRRLIIGIEIVALVTAISLAILTWRTVQEIQEQGNIMKQQILADNRPLVSIEIIDPGGFEIGKDFQFKYRIINYGNSPAVGIYINITALLWQNNGLTDFAALQKRMCEFGMRSEPYGTGPLVLFPQQDHLEMIVVDVFSKAAIEKSLEQAPQIEGLKWVTISPYIYGCVIYRAFDNTIHKTPFSVEIGRKPPIDAKNNTSEFWAIKTDEGAIPANLITLRGGVTSGPRISPD